MIMLSGSHFLVFLSGLNQNKIIPSRAVTISLLDSYILKGAGHCLILRSSITPTMLGAVPSIPKMDV